jgi:hypothetical protein
MFNSKLHYATASTAAKDGRSWPPRRASRTTGRLRARVGILLSLLTPCACATVEPGHAAVLLEPNGDTRILDEGVAVIPLYSKEHDFNVREQGKSAEIEALTADGVPITAGESLVTYRLLPADLVAVDRELGHDFVRTMIEPIVRSAARQVLAQYRWFELDTPHIREAEVLISSKAAERLRPHHISLEAVELRGIFARLPLFQRDLNDTSVWEQRAQEARIHLEVARQQAKALHQEALGIASAYRLIAPSLTESTLEDQSIRAWNALLSTRTSTVYLQNDSPSLVVEIPP